MRRRTSSSAIASRNFRSTNPHSAGYYPSSIDSTCAFPRPLPFTKPWSKIATSTRSNASRRRPASRGIWMMWLRWWMP